MFQAIAAVFCMLYAGIRRWCTGYCLSIELGASSFAFFEPDFLEAQPFALEYFTHLKPSARVRHANPSLRGRCDSSIQRFVAA